MSTEQMRGEFETWFKKEIIETEDFEFLPFDDEYGEYVVTEDDNVDLYLNIHMMYMGWQASRKAMVVELPDSFDAAMGAYGDTVVVTVSELKKCLRAAGITVKE